MRRLAAILLFVAVAGGLFAREELTGGAPGDRERGRVTRIVDGDTIHLAGLGSSRLIGVDTPEVNVDPDECYGGRATQILRSLLRDSGNRVRYRHGEEREDRYGRDLVYVWLRDGRFVNEELLLQGAAEVMTIAPNDRFERRFERAEARARRRSVGRWRVCGG